MRIVKIDEQSKNNILENLLQRSPSQYEEYSDRVNAILSDIRTKKDEALFNYTKRFDGCELTKDTIRVSEAEIEEAYTVVDT